MAVRARIAARRSLVTTSIVAVTPALVLALGASAVTTAPADEPGVPACSAGLAGDAGVHARFAALQGFAEMQAAYPTGGVANSLRKSDNTLQQALAHLGGERARAIDLFTHDASMIDHLTR